MSTYRLYKSPNGDIVRVKMGFSWQAFFVGSLSSDRPAHLAARRGRRHLLRGRDLLQRRADADLAHRRRRRSPASRFYAVYMLFCGVNGNRWLSDSLRRRGFTLIGEERR